MCGTGYKLYAICEQFLQSENFAQIKRQNKNKNLLPYPRQPLEGQCFTTFHFYRSIESFMDFLQKLLKNMFPLLYISELQMVRSRNSKGLQL